MRTRSKMGAFAAAFAAMMIGGAAMAAVGGGSAFRAGDTLDPADATARPVIHSQEPAPDRVEVPEVPPDPDPRLGEDANLDMVERDETPPRIAVIEPEDGSVVRVSPVLVVGRTEPGAVVTLGDRKADVDDDGRWWMRVELEPGRNRFVFHAVDAAGNVGEAAVTIGYIEPEWSFTAHQKWEVVDGDPVVNVYWGTTRPGAEVTIRSEYGHGSTTAGREGNWELRVEFPEAPCNQAFAVIAQSGDHAAEFKMKRACPIEVDFVAHQTYGECGEAIPYDVFWGGATPGATIWAESSYGGDSTTAGTEGHWELKVEFPDAPVGEAFEVVIESSDGGRAVFTFVRTGGDL